jgi:glycerol kinase
MHDGIDIMLTQNPADQFPVTCVTDYQLTKQYRLPETGTEVIQSNQPLTGFTQLAGGMATDIACAAGDQYASLAHQLTPVSSKPKRTHDTGSEE